MDIFDIRVVASINIINFLVTKLFGALPVFCSVLFCCISGSVAQPSGNYIVFIKMVFTFFPEQYGIEKFLKFLHTGGVLCAFFKFG